MPQILPDLRKVVNAAPELADGIVATGVVPSETVIVTGFWRSGTTWLLESIARSLGRKTVFEPFHHSISLYRSAVHGVDGLSESRGFLNLFMPHKAQNDVSKTEHLKEYLRRCLTSSVPGDWVRTARKDGRWESLRASLRTAVVTKFVRAQLLHPQLRKWYRPTILHIRRDPRAILYSFQKMWDEKWWSELSLEGQLLNVNDGRRQYFSNWTNEIKSLDEENATVRLTAYWVLTEKYVVDHKKESEAILLSYESLCADGESYLQRRIGERISKQRPLKLKGSSVMTPDSRQKLSSEERAQSWKSSLSTCMIKEVEETVRKLSAKNLV